MKNLLLAILLNLLVFQTVNSQTIATWRQYEGPYCGDLRSFIVKGDTVYAGGMFVTWYSTDSGESWQKKSDVEAVFTSIINYKSKLIAGSGTDIFISGNNALTWVKHSFPEVTGINQLFIFDDQIYVSTWKGVYLFDLVEKKLIPKSVGLQVDLQGLVVMDPFVNIGTHLFCGSMNTGLYESQDKGDSWAQLTSTSGLVIDGVRALVNINDTLIAAGYSNNQLFMSSDKGTNWVKITTGLVPFTIQYDIKVFKGSPVMATGDGVYTLDKKTLTWQIISNEVFDKLFVKDNLLLGNNVFGVYKWNVNEKLFQLSNKGINSAYVFDLLKFNNSLYCGTNSGLYYTSDDGASWNNVSITKGLQCRALSQNDSMLFVATNNGIYYRTLRSTNWKLSDNGIESKLIWDLKVKKNIIFAATDSGPCISKNSGKSWVGIKKGFRSVSSTITGNQLIQATNIATNKKMVLASNKFGLFRLLDDSISWEKVDIGEEGEVGMIETIDTTVYIYSKSGVSVSADDCKTWTSIVRAPNRNITGVSKRGDANLYMSTGGIWYSPDMGKNWQNWSETGMPELGLIYKVLFDESCMYAGLYGNGIYKREYLNGTDCNSETYNISNNEITNVPANTSVDLFKANLNLDHGASAEIISSTTKSGSLKMSTLTTVPYIKQGDIIKVIAEDGVTFRNYLVKMPTDVTDKVSSEIRLFPIPAKDKLYLTNTTDIKSMEIYNVSGVKVTNKPIVDNALDVSGLESGLYLLTITKTNNCILNLKFIKE